MDIGNYFVQLLAANTRTLRPSNVQKNLGLSRTKIEKMSYWGFLRFKLDARVTSFLMYSVP